MLFAVNSNIPELNEHRFDLMRNKSYMNQIFFVSFTSPFLHFRIIIYIDIYHTDKLSNINSTPLSLLSLFIVSFPCHVVSTFSFPIYVSLMPYYTFSFNFTIPLFFLFFAILSFFLLFRFSLLLILLYSSLHLQLF
jgi:hypothetical protein